MLRTMNTLDQIEAAAQALSPEQKKQLIHFLERGLAAEERLSRRARLVEGPGGTRLLEAPPDAPPMTTERVKQMLEDFP